MVVVGVLLASVPPAGSIRLYSLPRCLLCFSLVNVHHDTLQSSSRGSYERSRALAVRQCASARFSLNSHKPARRNRAKGMPEQIASQPVTSAKVGRCMNAKEHEAGRETHNRRPPDGSNRSQGPGGRTKPNAQLPSCSGCHWRWQHTDPALTTALAGGLAMSCVHWSPAVSAAWFALCLLHSLRAHAAVCRCCLLSAT